MLTARVEARDISLEEWMENPGDREWVNGELFKKKDMTLIVVTQNQQLIFTSDKTVN